MSPSSTPPAKSASNPNGWSAESGAPIAALREETRGSHWRDDFPERDDTTWAGHFDTVMSDGVAEIAFAPAPATDGVHA